MLIKIKININYPKNCPQFKRIKLFKRIWDWIPQLGFINKKRWLVEFTSYINNDSNLELIINDSADIKLTILYFSFTVSVPLTPAKLSTLIASINSIPKLRYLSISFLHSSTAESFIDSFNPSPSTCVTITCSEKLSSYHSLVLRSLKNKKFKV